MSLTDTSSRPTISVPPLEAMLDELFAVRADARDAEPGPVRHLFDDYFLGALTVNLARVPGGEAAWADALKSARRMVERHAARSTD